MRIICERPPNFDDIVKVFPMADNPGIIFAYWNTIYNPSGGEIPIPLKKHEAVHCVRQGETEAGTIEWWDKYLKDIEFRYEEELLAHRAEYQSCVDLAPHRNARRKALKHIASKLASPLYGPMVTVKKARMVLK